MRQSGGREFVCERAIKTNTSSAINKRSEGEDETKVRGLRGHLNRHSDKSSINNIPNDAKVS